MHMIPALWTGRAPTAKAEVAHAHKCRFQHLRRSLQKRNLCKSRGIDSVTDRADNRRQRLRRTWGLRRLRLSVLPGLRLRSWNFEHKRLQNLLSPGPGMWGSRTTSSTSLITSIIRALQHPVCLSVCQPDRDRTPELFSKKRERCQNWQPEGLTNRNRSGNITLARENNLSLQHTTKSGAVV